MSTEAPAAAPAAEPAAQEATPAAEATPATPAATPPAGGFLGGDAPPSEAPAKVNLFSGDVMEGDNFKEGWAENLSKSGYERLANKGKLASTPEAFLKSLDDTLGLVGKKQVAGYPNETWGDAELASFRQAAGVPDLPEGYNLKPDGLPDGIGFDEAEAKSYAEILHRHHVPEAAAKEMAKHHLAKMAEQQAQSQQAFDQQISTLQEQSAERFAKEWGDSYESRLEANKTYIATKFSSDELADPVVRAALSHPKIVEAIDSARRALREGPLPGVGTEAQSHSMSPRQQATDLMAKNPGWRNDTALAKRIQELYSLDAQQAKRRGG